MSSIFSSARPWPKAGDSDLQLRAQRAGAPFFALYMIIYNKELFYAV